MKCLLCGCDKPTRIITVREMMFGLREKFKYFECSRCESLTLVSKIKSFDKYYPSDYYSYSKRIYRTNNIIKSFLLKIRSLYVIEGKYKILGKFIEKIFKVPDRLKYLKHIGARINSNILDIGSGNGSFLSFLRYQGFKGQLVGQDPYLKETIPYDSDFYITNKDLTKITKKFDIITLWHSFEHTHNPEIILSKVKEILNDKGGIIIALPTTSSEAYKKYKENWYAIDAPYIYTFGKRIGSNFKQVWI